MNLVITTVKIESQIIKEGVSYCKAVIMDDKQPIVNLKIKTSFDLKNKIIVAFGNLEVTKSTYINVLQFCIGSECLNNQTIQYAQSLFFPKEIKITR